MSILFKEEAKKCKDQAHKKISAIIKPWEGIIPNTKIAKFFNDLNIIGLEIEKGNSLDTRICDKMLNNANEIILDFCRDYYEENQDVFHSQAKNFEYKLAGLVKLYAKNPDSRISDHCLEIYKLMRALVQGKQKTKDYADRKEEKYLMLAAELRENIKNTRKQKRIALQPYLDFAEDQQHKGKG